MNRDFKGIWIPREIWLAQELSCQEKCLWAEIHSLYDSEHGGCYASNEYLMEFLGVKERRLQEMIANLRKRGWIIPVHFDGRHRWIKAVVPKEDDDINRKDRAGQRCGKVHPTGAEKCTPEVQESAVTPYIENIDENKEEKRAFPSSSKKKKEKKIDSSSTFRISFGEYVLLKEGEYEKLCNEIGKGYVDYYIQAINNHIPNKTGIPYKDYAAAVRQWYLRAKADGKMPNVQKVQEISPSSSSPERLAKNKQLAELAEKKLSDMFNGRVFFQSTPTHALLVHLDKDIKKEISYEAYDILKFKEVILRELETCFPNARNILTGITQKKVANIINDLAEKFKRSEDNG